MSMSSKWLWGALALGLVTAACGDNAPSSQCNVSGNACTFLGMPGQIGFNGDGKDRLHTMLYWTMDTLFAQDGTVWFIDWNNHIIRRVGLDGLVTTMVGWNDPVFPGDGDMTDPTAEHSADGAPGGDVQLNHPTQLFQKADGTIMFMAWHNHKIRQIDPVTGHVKIVAGSGPGYTGDGGPEGAALFKQPSHFAFDEHENMFILDQQNLRIRYVDAATGTMSTIAGTGKQGHSGDNGPALQATLNFAIGSNPEPSGGLAYANGVLYIADTENHCIRAIDVATNMITTFAGTGAAGYAGDGGVAAQAAFYHPHALAIGPEGDLYVADTDNGVVRAINLTNTIVRTVAGTGEIGLDPTDDRPATETKLDRPFGISFDPQGNLYVADTLNSRVLRVAR